MSILCRVVWFVPVIVVVLGTGAVCAQGYPGKPLRVLIESDIAPALPRVYVDGSLIKSAVWNLVQNGVQSFASSVPVSAIAGWKIAIDVYQMIGTPVSQ